MPNARQRRTAPTPWLVLAGVLGLAAAGSAQDAPAEGVGDLEAPLRWSALLPVADGDPESAEAVSTWLARIEAQQSPDDSPVAEPVARIARLAALWHLEDQTLDRRDLAQFARVGQLLQQARQRAGQLEEGPALSLLIEAERALANLLHVPGAATLYAEVQTALGLVAAQAGMEPLALSALRRAAVVDPARGVRAAETTPAWVARAAQLSREVATGAQAEIPISANVEGARVYLDDRLQGTTPMRLRTTRGDHILRVEAVGHRALGTWLFADAGARPAVHAQLSPDPMLEALAELEASARDTDPERTRATLRTLQSMGLPLESVWLLRATNDRTDRALVTRCTVDSCEPTRRLELDQESTAPGYGIALDPAGLGRDRERRDQAWLTAVAPTAEPSEAATDWWTPGVVWGAAAVLVGGAIAAGVALNQGPESRGLRVTVEP